MHQPHAREIASRVVHRLSRLEVASRAIGIGEIAAESEPLVAFEQSTAVRELGYRLRAIKRECLWSVESRDSTEEAALSPLWERLALA